MRHSKQRKRKFPTKKDIKRGWKRRYKCKVDIDCYPNAKLNILECTNNEMFLILLSRFHLNRNYNWFSTLSCIARSHFERLTHALVSILAFEHSLGKRTNEWTNEWAWWQDSSNGRCHKSKSRVFDVVYFLLNINHFWWSSYNNMVNYAWSHKLLTHDSFILAFRIGAAHRHYNSKRDIVKCSIFTHFINELSLSLEYK